MHNVIHGVIYDLIHGVVYDVIHGFLTINLAITCIDRTGICLVTNWMESLAMHALT
jgi:hypothetical protein